MKLPVFEKNENRSFYRIYRSTTRFCPKSEQRITALDLNKFMKLPTDVSNEMRLLKTASVALTETRRLSQNYRRIDQDVHYSTHRMREKVRNDSSWREKCVFEEQLGHKVDSVSASCYFSDSGPTSSIFSFILFCEAGLRAPFFHFTKSKVAIYCVKTSSHQINVSKFHTAKLMRQNDKTTCNHTVVVWVTPVCLMKLNLPPVATREEFSTCYILPLISNLPQTKWVAFSWSSCIITRLQSCTHKQRISTSF